MSYTILDKSEIHPRLRNAGATGYVSGDENLSEDSEENIRAFERKNPHTRLLKSVPHLRLVAPVFDLEKARQEVLPHTHELVNCNLRTPLESETQGPLYQQHWCGRALVNYTRDSRDYFCKLSKEMAAKLSPELQPRASKMSKPRLEAEDMDYYETDIFQQMPYIQEYIKENICSRLYRSWIWVIRKDGYLNWHNHIQLPWHPHKICYDKGIVHIPLWTSPTSQMLVRHHERIYSRHYAAGEPWLFNYVSDHAVDNSRNPADRVHLTFFCPMNDPVFSRLINTSLAHADLSQTVFKAEDSAPAQSVFKP